MIYLNSPETHVPGIFGQSYSSLQSSQSSSPSHLNSILIHLRDDRHWKLSSLQCGGIRSGIEVTSQPLALFSWDIKHIQSQIYHPYEVIPLRKS